MEKYLSRGKLENREKINKKEVINMLQVEEPVYTYEEVKKLEGISREGLRAIYKLKRAFPGSCIEDVSGWRE